MTCNKCSINLIIGDNWPQYRKDKNWYICKDCYNQLFRKRNKAKPDLKKQVITTYEKTHKGFLVRLYRNMKSRIEGVQKAKYHLYEGKELLDKQDFYDWAMEHPIYIELFKLYRESKYDIKCAPSVDRKDSTKGYVISNMEWVTMSENSRRGATKNITQHCYYCSEVTASKQGDCVKCGFSKTHKIEEK